MFLLRDQEPPGNLVMLVNLHLVPHLGDEAVPAAQVVGTAVIITVKLKIPPST